MRSLLASERLSGAEQTKKLLKVRFSSLWQIMDENRRPQGYFQPTV